MAEQIPDHKAQLQHERWSLLQQIDAATDKPLIALSFVWLGLLILDFTRGLSPLLQTISYIIWGLFILDFGIGFLIAPSKTGYLRRNWLTVISLLLPALRVLRVFRALRVLRAARAVRGVSLLRLLTSLNRGMRAIGATLGRRGIGYVIAITVIVTFAGAAGMYAFESPAALCQNESATNQAACIQSYTGQGVGLDSYGESVWWTGMTMTTMGADYFPQSPEGRLLGWLLAVYAFAIFGYITATIASFFVGQDTGQNAATPIANDEVSALRAEIAALREQLAALPGGNGARIYDDYQTQQ
jgi:voltage-gated potassium channel